MLNQPLKPYLLLIFLLGNFFIDLDGQQIILTAKEQANIEAASKRIESKDFKYINLKASQQRNKKPSEPNLYPSFQPPFLRTQTSLCVDSSFLKVFESADRSYSLFCSAKTSDGGILIGGYGRNNMEALLVVSFRKAVV